MNIEELNIGRPFGAKLISTKALTEPEVEQEVRELVLELPGSGQTPEVGQSVGVLAPGLAELGQTHHLRLYSVADVPASTAEGAVRIRIAVRRCTHIDEYSGERYAGVASNYLCDLAAGSKLQLVGPFGSCFEVPRERSADLILIATSTGIAPFRAFVRKLHEDSDFSGKIWLFYGAKCGLDLVYMNRQQDDFSQYYDRETFEAFQAFSPRPHFGDDINWGETLQERGAELWRRLGLPSTYVYVAGLASAERGLESALEKLADSPSIWRRRKAELVAGKRWVELLY